MARVLVLSIAGSLGCQALPQLTDPASNQSVASRLVAGAATPLCAGALDWLRAEPTREVRLQWPMPSPSAGDSADIVNKHDVACSERLFSRNRTRGAQRTRPPSSQPDGGRDHADGAGGQ